ncbi:hypothetical protein B6D29_03785 [Microgenomates bacterium UTCPR1]|nr:MAG: hypothetical protein B6D29_03785 [Microgenomates bacterium UTCPR1]
MIDERFIFIGFFLSLYGSVNYLADTIKGKTKPNRVSWLLWSIAPLIAFFAEIQKGVGLQSLMTFSVGFGPLLIFLASFLNKKSYWNLNKFDYFYGLLSAIGIIIWKLTGEGNIAIFFSVLADLLAGIPTIIKSYIAPESESYSVYLFSSFNAIITLLTIKTWTFAHWAFPVYILLIDVVLFSLIKFQIGKKFQKNKPQR